MPIKAIKINGFKSFADKMTIELDPTFTGIVGPNGSGKSTITKFFEIAGEYTNADDVVSSTGMENEEAAKFVDKKRYDSIEAKSDLTFETVLSSKYKMDILLLMMIVKKLLNHIMKLIMKMIMNL